MSVTTPQWPSQVLTRVGHRFNDTADSMRNRSGAVLATWAATRALLVVVSILQGGVWGDIGIYLKWAAPISNGIFPYTDPMWQYPPLAGFVFVAARWFDPVLYSGFAIMAILADLIIMALLIVDGRMRTPRRFQGAWLWAFAGLIIGPVLLGRFDVFVAMIAVVIVIFLGRAKTSRRSGIWAGIFTSIGILLKVWPGLLLIAAPRKAMARIITAALGTTVLIMAAILPLTGGSMSFLKFQGARGLQLESVGSIPYLIGGMFGLPFKVAYRYGCDEIRGPLVEQVGMALTLGGLVVLAALFLMRIMGRLDHAPIRDLALVAVLISVVTSRVYSPQYNVWLLALGALCLADPRSTMRKVVKLVIAASILATIIYPWLYDGLRAAEWYAVPLQTLRIVLIVWATVLAIKNVLPQRRGSFDPMHKVSPPSA